MANMLNLFSKRLQLGYIGNVIWELEGSVLTISESGVIPDYSQNAGVWYSNAQTITKVIIGDGITSIGSYSFQNFGKDGSSGITIEVGSGVTRINQNAFYLCGYNNQGNVNLVFNCPSTTISSNAFYRVGELCHSKVSIAFTNSSIATIDTYAFYHLGYKCAGSVSFKANFFSSNINSCAFYESALGSAGSSVVLTGTISKINSQAFYSFGCNSTRPVSFDIEDCSYIGQSAFKFLGKESSGSLTFKANCIEVTIESYAFNEAGVRNPNVSIILTGTIYTIKEYSFMNAGNSADGPIFIDIQAAVPYFGVSSFQGVGKEAKGNLTIIAKCKDATFDTSSFYEAGKENKGDVQIIMTGTVAKIGKTGFYCAGYNATGQVDIDILSMVPNIATNAFQNASRVYVNAPRRQLSQIVKCYNIRYATQNQLKWRLRYKVAFVSLLLNYK